MIIDPMVISAPETQSAAASILVAQSELEFGVCDYCGLTEECTPAYMERIRQRYFRKWDEIVRFDKLVCIEEAMAKHMNLTNKLKASRPPPNPALHLISAMRQILRRTLDSPKVRSTPNSPTKTLTKIHGSVLTRSES
ncbi:hypothetical protein D0Y65_048716 [Glycine soja]|uniref:Uncharacterized protein n=1 Tax=Glycine soja TaxID=3848 RepID=A0A445FTW9_GLYSO|nr:hypothetical protein D0Y65_048716 [Glycine soja]